MSAVPANIDALLIKFDMSQEELGNTVGVTQSAVSGWRRGKTPSRKLPLGSYALINPTHEILDGKVYAVCIDAKNVTFKRIERLNNGIKLLPDSTDPTFKSIYFDFAETSKECIVIIGQVVWYCVPFDFEI